MRKEGGQQATNERTPSTHVVEDDCLDVVAQQSSESIPDLGNEAVKRAAGDVFARMGQSEAADFISETICYLLEDRAEGTVVHEGWRF